MRHRSKQAAFVRTEDRKTVMKSIFLREVLFRRAVTADSVRAGLHPRKPASQD